MQTPIALIYTSGAAVLVGMGTLAWNVITTARANERRSRLKLFDDQIGKSIERRLGLVRDAHELIADLAQHSKEREIGVAKSSSIDAIRKGRLLVHLQALHSSIIVIEKNIGLYFPNNRYNKFEFLDLVRESSFFQSMRSIVEQNEFFINDEIINMKNSKIHNVNSDMSKLNTYFYRLDEELRGSIGDLRSKILNHKPNSILRRIRINKIGILE